MEVSPDGKLQPFPDKEWNRWNKKPETAANHFVCVQSVVVDDNDSLWVVDAGAPMLTAVVPGGAKLVVVDLKTNQVSRVIPLGPDVAKLEAHERYSYRHTAGSSLSDRQRRGRYCDRRPAHGKSHRSLDGDPSVLPEQGVSIVIDGKPVLENGKPPQFNSDSLALSPDGDYLYYKPITAKTLYRIKTEVLRGGQLPQKMSSAVERVGETFPTDGLWMDRRGNLYLSDLDHNAVVVRTPDGHMKKIVRDSRLQWPDTFSEGPDGTIYISASHINESPTYNEGKSANTTPYGVYKFNRNRYLSF